MSAHILCVRITACFSVQNSRRPQRQTAFCRGLKITFSYPGGKFSHIDVDFREWHGSNSSLTTKLEVHWYSEDPPMPRISGNQPVTGNTVNTSSTSSTSSASRPASKTLSDASGLGPRGQPSAASASRIMSPAPRQSGANNCWAAAAEASVHTYGMQGPTQDQIAAALNRSGQGGRPDLAHQQAGIHHMTYKFDPSISPKRKEEALRQEINHQINDLRRPMALFVSEGSNTGGIGWKHALAVTGFDSATKVVTLSDPGRPSAQAQNEVPLRATTAQLAAGWKPYPGTQYDHLQVTVQSMYTTQTPRNSPTP